MTDEELHAVLHDNAREREARERRERALELRCEVCGELEPTAGAHRTSVVMCGETVMRCDPAAIRRHRDRLSREGRSMPSEALQRPPPRWSW